MLSYIFRSLSIWIIVIPFLVGIMNYKGLNKDSKWIFSLVLIALVPQILSAFIAEGSPLLNLFYNIYTPVEFFILFQIFQSKNSSRLNGRVIYISAILYAVSCGYFFIRFGLTDKFLHGLVCINNIIYMLWILLLLRQEYSAEYTIIEKSNPFTWYLIAIILYASGTIAIFALYYYIRTPGNGSLMNLPVIQSAFNILMYLLFSIGLLIRKT